MENTLDPAATIIEMCGGILNVAAVLGCHRSTVYRWMQPEGPRCGRGGMVPLRHVLPLMRAFPGLSADMFFRNVGKPQNGKSE